MNNMLLFFSIQASTMNTPFKVTLCFFAAFAILLTLPSGAYSQDFGNALEFDGLDDFVFIGNDSSLHVDQFTLTSWVHPYSYSEPLPDEQRMEVLEKAGEYWMNISTSDAGYQRDMGEVRVGGIFEGQWHFLDSEFIVPLNQWTHVACTYDYDSLKLYINGELDVSKAIPEMHTDQNSSDNMLALGCKNVSGPFDPIEAQFHGMLDEISIWDTALSVLDIRALKNQGVQQSDPHWTELVAYYKFDEANIGSNSGDVQDEKGLNHGTNYGAYWVSNSTTGISGNSLFTQLPILQQNYPNPFRDLTHIPFYLTQAGSVQIDIYDTGGRLVQNVVKAQFDQGDHVVQWKTSGLPEGIYFYELATGGITESRICIITK